MNLEKYRLDEQYCQNNNTAVETKIKIQFNMSEHEKRLMLSSGKLVSIAEVAEQTPYSAEYLSLLARKGRIPAVKLTRDWLTTHQAVSLYVKKQRQKHKQLLNRFERAGRAV